MNSGTRIDFLVPGDAGRSACRSCGAAIAWTLTGKGKRMPLDLSTVEERDGKRYALSHFALCPNSAAHRNTRPKN